MNKVFKLLPLFFLMILVAGNVSAQILVDGDSTDWAGEPALINWVNNQDGWYPTEVGAAITDVVNVKQVKAKIQGNALYVFVRFWGAPAWPNNVDEKTNGTTGETGFRSRGYYHILLDLDNDPSTGWNSEYYETHYTPVGYLRSQGQTQLEAVGSESYIAWGASYSESWNGGTVGFGYEGEDHSEFNHQTDTGVTYSIFDFSPADPDSNDGMGWQGTLRYLETEAGDNLPVGDGLRSFWVGHAWGQIDNPATVDFVELGYELTPFTEYWHNKGMDYFKAGDDIGIAAFIETPADDWGCDLTERGILNIPEEIPSRPDESVITVDGDSADWSNERDGLRWVNNQDGWYPTEVGAAITDVINVRSLKVYVDENQFYFFMRMWGAPAWPNNVDEKTNGTTGETGFRSRGYYHVVIDLDNDPSTGWNTEYYETHYTPVGYLISQGQTQLETVGSETYFAWGGRYFEPWAGPDGKGGIDNIGYESEDHSEFNHQTDTGVSYNIFDIDIAKPDSSLGMQHNGMMVLKAEHSDAESVVDGKPIWMAHAWGEDFLEAGYDLRPLKEYWLAKDGTEVFKSGDQIGFAAFVETPADDWGVDMTSRGQTSVIDGIKDVRTVVADEFVLENNYPNPFNPTTTINYVVPNTSNITLVVYNTLGQKVKTLVNGKMPKGQHSVQWNATNDRGTLLPSGLYFYTLKSNSTSITKKMLLVK